MYIEDSSSYLSICMYSHCNCMSHLKLLQTGTKDKDRQSRDVQAKRNAIRIKIATVFTVSL